MPEYKLLPIGKLNPSANNANTHPPEQIRELAESFRQFGFLGVVVVDENHSILAGEGRYLGAKLAKLKRIPVMVAAGLSERQKRAFMLADNRIGKNSVIDPEKLAAELAALVDMDFDLSVTGYNEQEIDAILRQDIRLLPDASIAVGAHLRRREAEKKELPDLPTFTFWIGEKEIDISAANQKKALSLLVSGYWPEIASAKQIKL